MSSAAPGIATEEIRQKLDLPGLGVKVGQDVPVFHNLSYEEIHTHEKEFGETAQIDNGTMAVDTGKFTGRSPKDRFIVKQSPSEKDIDWNKINQPADPEVFDELYNKCTNYFSSTPKRLYVFDGWVGASDKSCRHVRFVTELAWQHHFVTNMFRRPTKEQAKELAGREPDFVVLNCCKITDEDWKKHSLHSEVFVIFNVERKRAIIGGTYYGGEMKKGIFAMMNMWCPLNNVLTMHCSANKAKDGNDTAIFFGLSGTGKTTLSSDPNRELIGDDEHGWDDTGIWNLEGGCYAKTYKLDPKAEPEIYNAIRPGALLENIKIREDGVPDYDDGSKTENGRVSYPLTHIDNRVDSGRGQHPSCILFLACDAYGVLPPVSRLTRGQAMYHFLSGYSAKVAGTERGVTEPVATFSYCFGDVFMPLHPTVYAKLLGEKMEKYDTKAYLVNTGWSGGPYGVGKRMKIQVTRSCVNAILDGSIEKCEFETEPFFGLSIPKSLPGVESSLLNPRNTWDNKEQYDEQAKMLAKKFVDNYKRFQGSDYPDFSKYGPQISA
eukprot:gb/GECG01016700.1/.p1 GENE.gb/GECG01016700.1/~~gb/GECG01016700.1/.p1  ORF type:complete len:549 (+),score=66.02 gb/GECG01016700.1/:1-1647(+)